MLFNGTAECSKTTFVSQCVKAGCLTEPEAQALADIIAETKPIPMDLPDNYLTQEQLEAFLGANATEAELGVLTAVVVD